MKHTRTHSLLMAGVGALRAQSAGPAFRLAAQSRWLTEYGTKKTKCTKFVC